jgi:cell wall-associated NlpC family hydrolase
MTELDHRLNAYRDDLADARLKGRVNAAEFVDGTLREVVVPAAAVRSGPRRDASLDTEALQGERVSLFEELHGWAWVQLAGDGYVGHVKADQLGPVGPEPTHRVAALRTFVYPSASIKAPAERLLSINARLAVTAVDGKLAALAGGGFVVADHLVPVDAAGGDFVAVAERFVGTPYLWGGKTSLGLDCSGLLQTAMHAVGRACPRDSDMQEEVVGEVLPGPADHGALRRGDLVFWEGHVGLMLDATRLLHANGHHMQTVIEPLAAAVARTGAVRTVRRAG